MKKDHLRIAMIGHKRIPSREGGVEVVVGELGARLCGLGHRVVCYNRRSGKGGATPPAHWRGMELRSAITIGRRGIAAVTSSVAAAVCAAFGPYDVVHFHAEGPSAMLWLPRLMGKRCICTVHGLDHRREKWKSGLGGWYMRLGERVAVRFADEIIVLSRHMQAYFLERYGRRTVYIPNGVNPPVRRKPRLIRSRFGLDAGSYILYLGRIEPGKGVDDLIDAYCGLQTDKRLVIAGDGADCPGYVRMLRERAAQNERIVFTGFAEGEMLDELYTNAYVFVLPSYSEGMPLSLLEALSCGSCCVTSDIPECAEVVGRYGVTFARGSVDALRAALQTLCDEPETVQAYRACTAAYARARFSWEQMTRRTLALYTQEECATEDREIEETERPFVA